MWAPKEFVELLQDFKFYIAFILAYHLVASALEKQASHHG
jgi:hypothetical protein